MAIPRWTRRIHRPIAAVGLLFLPAMMKAQTPAPDSVAKDSAKAAPPLLTDTVACTRLNETSATTDSIQEALLGSGKMHAKSDTSIAGGTTRINTRFTYTDPAAQKMVLDAAQGTQRLLDSIFVGRKQLQCQDENKMTYTVSAQNGGYTWQRLGGPPKKRKPPR